MLKMDMVMRMGKVAFKGYIKIGDLEPSSSLMFVYPYSDDLEYGK